MTFTGSGGGAIAYIAGSELGKRIELKEIEWQWLDHCTYYVDFVGVGWVHNLETGVLKLTMLEYLEKLVARFGLSGPERSTPMDKEV